MTLVSVRCRNGRWLVDVSAKIDGKATRSIKSFGRGTRAMIAAEEYRDEIASRTQPNAGRFWQRMTMPFEGLWRRFVADELDGGAVTSIRIKTLGQLYLLPHLGSRLLAEIGVKELMNLERALQPAPTNDLGGSDHEKRPPSPLVVARVMTLGATVWRYGRRVNLVDGNPFANLRRANADPTYKIPAIDRSRYSTRMADREDPHSIAIEFTHRRHNKR